MEEEIKELKVTINNLLAQNALLYAKTNLLESALLDIASDGLPENSQKFFSSYVDCLEESSLAFLQELQGSYYQVNDPQFAFRQFVHSKQVFEMMKKDKRYLRKE